MKKTLLLFLCICIYSIQVQGQLLTGSVIFPTDTDNLSITVDASKGNGGLNNYGSLNDVFVHTGVITNLSSSGSDWKYVKLGSQSPWGKTLPELQAVSLGNNRFSNNREFDINNATTIPLTAAGNQITRSRVKGLLDLTASSSPISPIATIPSSSRPTPSTAIPIQRPVPTTVFVPAKPPTQSLPSPVISTNPNPSGNNSPTTITIERAYSGNSSTPRLPNQASLPVALDPTTGKAFQYRVIVPSTTILVSQRVRTIVPDAFRLSRSGRSVLQVGAYSDRQAANELVQKLAQSGVNAEVVPFR